MKFNIKTLPSSELYTMRRLGYIFIDDRRTGKQSYVRSIYSEHYPRFHIYINQNIDKTYQFNLHIDQKQASYEGSRMHSGEHDGEVVQQEVNRIKQALEK